MFNFEKLQLSTAELMLLELISHTSMFSEQSKSHPLKGYPEKGGPRCKVAIQGILINSLLM